MNAHGRQGGASYLIVFVLLVCGVLGGFVLVAFLYNEKELNNLTLDADVISLANNPTYQLHYKKCQYDPGNLNRELECGELSIQTAHKRFVLPWVKIKSTQNNIEEPLIYLPGGPGSAIDLSQTGIESWLAWLERANIPHDLILVDQRGTGNAQPQFTCGHIEQNLREGLAKNLNQSEDAIQLKNAIAQCINEFTLAGFSFVDFNSTATARDLQALMELLGYEKWNVMGASYGTRVAINWSQTSDNIHAMVLDSSYPPGKGGLSYWPTNLQNSFSVLWPSCLPQAGCNEVDRKNHQQFWNLVETLEQSPVTVSISLWQGGWPLNVVINNHRFVFMVYSALYRPSGVGQVKQLIGQSSPKSTESISILTSLAERSINSDLDPLFNPFTFFMIDCQENSRPTIEEFEQLRQIAPDFIDVTQNAVQEDICQLFPLRSDLDEFNSLQLDPTPVLFLSGGNDPVTPGVWVDDILQLFPNGHLWTMPGLSHGVTSNSGCVLQQVPEFLLKPLEVLGNPCLSD